MGNVLERALLASASVRLGICTLSPFIHPLNKCLLSAHSGPGAVPFGDPQLQGDERKHPWGLGWPPPLTPGMNSDKALPLPAYHLHVYKRSILRYP